MFGPNYRRPGVNTPTVFRGSSGAAQQASFADLPWWDVFKEGTLKGLVKTALANNYDLAVAVARVEQARQVAAVARSEYFPSINYASIVSYGHNQFVNSPASPSPNAQGFLMSIARASWEADLWGRVRRTNEAARARYLGSEAARRGTMLILVSEVSQAYFELLGLRYKLEISEETAQTYRAILNLSTERRNGGLGNELQTSRAAADLSATTASITGTGRAHRLEGKPDQPVAGKESRANRDKAETR